MRFYLFFLSLVFLFSCSKEKQTKRLLCNQWELIKVQIEDGEGFSYVSEDVSGELRIDEVLNFNGDLAYSFLSIQGTSVSDSVKWSNNIGTFQDSKTIGFSNWSPATSIRILVLTRSYCQLVYYDLNHYRLVGLIFKRS